MEKRLTLVLILDFREGQVLRGELAKKGRVGREVGDIWMGNVRFEREAVSLFLPNKPNFG